MAFPLHERVAWLTQKSFAFPQKMIPPSHYVEQATEEREEREEGGEGEREGEQKYEASNVIEAILQRKQANPCLVDGVLYFQGTPQVIHYWMEGILGELMELGATYNTFPRVLSLSLSLSLSYFFCFAFFLNFDGCIGRIYSPKGHRFLIASFTRFSRWG